jgi:hypothetical protein
VSILTSCEWKSREGTPLLSPPLPIHQPHSRRGVARAHVPAGLVFFPSRCVCMCVCRVAAGSFAQFVCPTGILNPVLPFPASADTNAYVSMATAAFTREEIRGQLTSALLAVDFCNSCSPSQPWPCRSRRLPSAVLLHFSLFVRSLVHATSARISCANQVHALNGCAAELCWAWLLPRPRLRVRAD